MAQRGRPPDTNIYRIRSTWRELCELGQLRANDQTVLLAARARRHAGQLWDAEFTHASVRTQCRYLRQMIEDGVLKGPL